MRRKVKEYSDIVLRPEDLVGIIDFAQIFGRTAPVHVEIGSGKGTFLVNEARARPEVDFLGIEWARRYYRYAVDRIGRWGLTNVRLLRTEAAEFLRNSVRDESVECFHVYFPDPWPKKRQYRKRFLQWSNVQTMIRCLKRGGTIHIATDHADYFEQIEAVVSSFDDQLERIEFPRPSGAKEGELTGTNYERKYLEDGRSVYVLAVRKITVASRGSSENPR